MKYDEDTDWGGTDEDGEDEAEFVCMRKVRTSIQATPTGTQNKDNKNHLDSEIPVKPSL